MNKKKIVAVILILLSAAIYISWKIRSSNLDRQRAQERHQRALETKDLYSACLQRAEEEYKQNLKSVDLNLTSKSEIDRKLAEYEDQYQQTWSLCFKQYPEAASEQRIQDALDRSIELRKRYSDVEN